jgi:hypothetical protein
MDRISGPSAKKPPQSPSRTGGKNFEMRIADLSEPAWQ